MAQAQIVNPVVENWYKELETKAIFKVVAIDEGQDSIEFQYDNGDVGEYDWDSWCTTVLESVEAPEDWNAGFNGLEMDDFGYTDNDNHDPVHQGNVEDIYDLLED